MSDLDLTVRTFLDLGDKITKLEETRAELRAELGGLLQEGDTIMHKGIVYEWEKYDRTSTSWKGLYTDAYTMADDEVQVIMSEKELKATKKSGPFYRFAKKKA